ncbi:hypothetical protein T552_00604 [Pneumocystis carinii B80]|uniref:UBX domain-containing protein n=1 Tax=Pneumocystis carinii (strain B80) TaxID=1408658 RepID=A0A0W4ZP14_PNEC8|nr:hypothetical protein T552_00604 [Pneumocystis carinii B80]KTW30126.1 hypothetical protein T552_00604 [Pneumocystis carinii B80]
MTKDLLMDEAICQFCSVTFASLKDAKYYLDLSCMDLEQAIELYYESRNVKEGIEMPSGENISDDSFVQAIEKNTEKDVFKGPDVSKNDNVNDLVVEKWNNTSKSNTSETIPKYTQSYLNRIRKSVFNQSFSRVWEDDEFSAASKERSKKSRASYLFRPPFDIIKNIDFESAKELAKNKMLWVMVNLQDNTDFLCQKLNRDLWKDQRVKDVILKNFIFLQYISTSSDGILYQQFYPIKEYPHISIIDPRTGERVKVWDSSLIEPNNFLMDLHDFLETYSLDPDFKNPITQKLSAKKVEDMSESEQINAALIASLNERNKISNHKRVSSKDEVIVIFDDSDVNHNGYLFYFIILSLTLKDIQKSPSLFEKIPAVTPSEPNAMSKDITNIQFRFSDGSKKVRLFNLSDKVSRLFEYIKSELATNSKEFELVFNRIKLINELDQTLEALKLKNANITVEYI